MSFAASTSTARRLKTRAYLYLCIITRGFSSKCQMMTGGHSIRYPITVVFRVAELCDGQPHLVANP